MTWDKLVAFWESIPTPIRTVVNGFVAVLLTALVSYVTTGDLSWKDAVLIPFVQLLVRWFNPADQAYGWSPKTVQPAPEGDVQDAP